jgi:hypothetical protein
MRLDSMALPEDCEAIQLSIMHVVDGLVKGTLEPTRARLIIQALRIAARNAKNVRFDDVHYRSSEQPMVRQVPDYARQYLIEHPEIGPPLSSSGTRAADALARAAGTNASPCGADTPVRQASTIAVNATRKKPQQNASRAGVSAEPVAKQRQTTAHAASRGTESENDPAPQERKKPERDTQQRDLQKKENELKRVQAAIAGAERGNWRDLRTVFEFAGIAAQNKESPS